jgi:K+-transporting ATPase A subunit
MLRHFVSSLGSVRLLSSLCVVSFAMLVVPLASSSRHGQSGFCEGASVAISTPSAASMTRESYCPQDTAATNGSNIVASVATSLSMLTNLSLTLLTLLLFPRFLEMLTTELHLDVIVINDVVRVTDKSRER